MQTLLNDIELDIQELKCLMHAIAGDVNPTLRVVAKRNIQQMKVRLDALSKLLEEPITTVPAETGVPVVVELVSEEESIPEPQESVSKLQIPLPEVKASASEPSAKVPELPEPILPITSSVSSITTSTSSILAERIKPATDLRHAISLNDSFRFTRELFSGDAVRMNEVVRQLGETSSLDKALDIFNSTVRPDEENVAAADFVELLKKYFS